METLKTVQTLAKIGRIFSKIIFIFSLIGGIACVAGIVSFALIPDGIKIGGVTIRGLVEKSAEVSTGTLYTVMAIGVVLCAGEAVLSKIAERYFKCELADGTPFTFDGAKSLIRLGVCTICIPLGTSVVAAIVYAIMKHSFEGVADLNFSDYVSAGLGVMFIVTGVICRYGAQLREKSEGNALAEE